MSEKKYRTIVIDTVNQIQNDTYTAYMRDKGKPGFDEWRDFGVEMLDLYSFIRDLTHTIPVQILGTEGTGKTVGASFLNPDTNVWLNADRKPLTFTGAKKLYPVDNSRKNYIEVASYKDLKYYLKLIHEKSMDPFIVFVLGHTEGFKQAGVERERLKILGKMAAKQNIEGLLTHTYYTFVDPTIPIGDSKRYKLSTMNSGYNTARSPMGYWNEMYIPNNFQLIVDKILEDS